METTQQLMEENIKLKRALAIALNRPLLKKLALALKRIEDGDYITEEEFFKNSPLKNSEFSHL